ncbi:ComF family protein [Desulfovibrio sp. OttesenSCG-928-M14]|nr:ComF family protein [Desulfovibrio sp. OttesenSCG-928-M14]
MPKALCVLRTLQLMTDKNRIPAVLHAFIRETGALLFGERRCLVCSALIAPMQRKAVSLCPVCTGAMPRREKGLCPLCGEAAAWPDLPLAPCGRCLRAAPPWSAFVCHGPHEGLLRHLLIRLKFGGQIHLGPLLGALLAAHPLCVNLQPDLITPIPLHPKRLNERGYNQAQLLARPLAAALQRPLAPQLLQRVKESAPQTGADRETRLRNLHRVFAADNKVCGKHILLVDDTMTTGATLAEATSCLLAAGANQVSVAVVSRTTRYWR